MSFYSYKLSLVAILACGCGGTNRASQISAQVVSSKTLFSFIQRLPPPVKSAAFAEIGSLTVAQYYDRLVAKATDKPVVIDGIAVTNSRSSLLADRDAFLAIGELFSTVGEIWDLRGLDASAVTLTQYQSALAKSLTPAPEAQASHGLSLYIVPQKLYPVTKGPNKEKCDLFTEMLDKRFNAPDADTLVASANAIRASCANAISDPSGDTDVILSTNIPDGKSSPTGAGSILTMNSVCMEAATTDATIVYNQATGGGPRDILSDHNAYRQLCMTTQKSGNSVVPWGKAEPQFTPDDIMSRPFFN